MKNAEKSNKSKTTAGLTMVAAAVITFLLLPVFFSDQPENLLLENNDGIEGSLPVIMSENPLSKYLRKAKSFYSMGKKNNTAFGQARGVLPPPPDQEYTDEERAAIFASLTRARIAAAVQTQSSGEQGQTAANANSIVVQPDARGYYYGDKYYANATYPEGADAALKKSIENSIFSFHEAQAQKEGKSAAYVLQDDGSLLVKYLPKKEFDALRLGKGGDYYAAANKYSGAKILSKNASGGQESYSRSGGGQNTSADGVFGDVGASYFAASSKSAGMRVQSKAAAAQKPQQDNNQGGGSGQQDDKKFIEDLKEFDKEAFHQPGRLRRGGENFPFKYDDKTFDDKQSYIEKKLLDGPLANLGLSLGDFKNAKAADLSDKAFREKLRADAQAEDGPHVKVFDGSNGFETYRILRDENFFAQTPSRTDRTSSGIREQRGSYEVDKIFLNFVSVPAYNPGNPPNPDTVYSDTYWKNTALGPTLRQMEADPAKIKEIEAGYKRLDARNVVVKKEIEAFLAANPSLKDLDIELYYVLGREGNKIIVAAKNSMFYAANQGLAPKDKKYNPDDPNKLYVSVNEEDFKKDYNNPKKISTGFAITDNGEDAAIGDKKIYGKTTEEISSTAVKDLEARLNAAGKAIYFELQNTLDEQTKQKIKERREKRRQLKETAGILKEDVGNMNKPASPIPLYTIPGQPKQQQIPYRPEGT